MYDARMKKMREERIEMDRWRYGTVKERSVTPVGASAHGVTRASGSTRARGLPHRRVP
jgi:hypothetical protein